MFSISCRAILFDLDGVLVDSGGAVARVWGRWARENGLDAGPIVAKAHGRRTIETIREFAPHLEGAEAEKAERRVEQMEIDDTEGMRAVRGAAALLSRLPAACWTIVTSGARPLAEARLRAVGLPLPPRFISGDLVRQGKPHPEPYLKGAELLGAAATECIVVEDAPAGIQAGKAAGARVIALTTTYPRPRLSHADWIVGSLEDLAVEVACSAVPGLRVSTRNSGSGSFNLGES